MRALNGRVLQFHTALQRADNADGARIRAEAAPVFAERAAALTALIREDPATITKSGGVPVAGATVTFKMTRPGGTTTTTATTNSSGIAQWKYKTQQKGSYSVTVTASSGGMTASGRPVNFTAN